MYPVYLQNEQGDLIGMNVYTSQGSLITKTQLFQLMPYLKEMIKEGCKQKHYKNLVENKLNVLEKDGEVGFSFDNLTKNEQRNLTKILEQTSFLFRELLGVIIFVPQILTDIPPLHHKPFYFQVNRSKQVILVRFTQIGELNDFDMALNDLKKRFIRVIDTIFIDSEEETEQNPNELSTANGNDNNGTIGYTYNLNDNDIDGADRSDDFDNFDDHLNYYKRIRL